MSQELRKKLAKNLKKIREINSVSREKLSLILGYDNSYISKLEREKVNITLDKLSQIAEYFNVEVVDLLK